MAESDFKIVSTPELTSLTAGAQILYECLYQGGREYPPTISASGPGIAFSFRWYLVLDRLDADGGHPIIKDGPIGPPRWQLEWDQDEGQYDIACEILDLSRNKFVCFLGQRVTSVDAALAPLLGSERKFVAAHPDEGVSHVEQTIYNVKMAQSKIPASTPDQEKEFNDKIAGLEQYLVALKAKLKSTEGKQRIPIHAVQFSVADQKERQLTVFVAKVRSVPAHIEITEGGGRLWKRVPDRQEWALVDWTDPILPEVCQEVGTDGSVAGETDELAIQNLIEGWNFTGNRYPQGKIAYVIEVPGIKTFEGSFKTNGRTTWDLVSKVLGTVSFAGMIVAGVATLIIPVPGSQIVSAAIWTSILSSTASAVINIAQRLDEGSGTWKDNVFDGLTIVGNLLAGIGEVARVAQIAESAGWARGATLKWTDSGKVLKYSLIGQVGNDAVQGIMVADSAIDDYEKIIKDKSLSPVQRNQKLMDWLRNLTGTAALIFISIRSSALDLKNLSKTNKYLPPDKGTGKKVNTDDLNITSSKEKLDTLGDKTKTVDLDKPPVTEGNTAPKDSDKNVATVHNDTAQTGMASRQHLAESVPTFEGQFPQKEIWTQRSFTPEEIVIAHENPNHPGERDKDFIFRATNRDGSVEVKIVLVDPENKDTRSQYLGSAADLFNMMYAHFERNKVPIRAWKGELWWTNSEYITKFLTAKGYDAADAAARKMIEMQAPFESYTGKKFWKPWADSKGYKPVVKKFVRGDSGEPKYPYFYTFEVEFE